MFTPPPSEADLLEQAKWLLDLLEKYGYLAYTRVSVGGKIFGRKLVPNTEMRGFSDLEIIAKGRVLYVELKSKKGKRSEDQIKFQERMGRAGAMVVPECKRLEELVEALEKFGVPARNFLGVKT